MNNLNETDFKILQVLENGKRNVAANVALEIDADRGYINTRFGYLLEHELVERVGPKTDSGLYEITDKGKVVVQNKSFYYNADSQDFERLIQSEIA